MESNRVTARNEDLLLLPQQAQTVVLDSARRNGRIMARSREEGYTTEVAVLNAIQNIQGNVPTARVIRGTNKLNAP